VGDANMWSIFVCPISIWHPMLVYMLRYCTDYIQLISLLSDLYYSAPWINPIDTSFSYTHIIFCINEIYPHVCISHEIYSTIWWLFLFDKNTITFYWLAHNHLTRILLRFSTVTLKKQNTRLFSYLILLIATGSPCGHTLLFSTLLFEKNTIT
jgi:hypothetical protein